MSVENCQKWALIALAIVLMLCIVLNALIAHFLSPGIHVFWKYAHISFVKKCYFIDQSDGKPTVAGESTLCISGVLYDKYRKPFSKSRQTSGFEGVIVLEDMPMSVHKSMQTHFGYITGDYIRITNLAYDMIPYDESREPDGAAGRYYDVFIYRTSPELIEIAVSSTDENVKTVYAICADSPEEALENWYAAAEAFKNAVKRAVSEPWIPEDPG